MFRSDIAPCESAVNSSVTAPLTQNQFDSLCSVSFNIGVPRFKSSTLVKKINAQADSATIEKWLKVWNQADGKVSPGLVNRRASEWAQYCGVPFVASATARVDTPQSWWAKAHNQIIGAGATLTGYATFDPDRIQTAGQTLQSFATTSPWFMWLGIGLVVLGLAYKTLKK